MHGIPFQEATVIAPVKPLESFVPFSPPLIGDEAIKEVVDTLRSGWLTTGPKTERFEAVAAEYVQADHAVAVSSCTAALHLALHALDVGETDGVITTPYTFASTGHVILYQRARPFFVDVEADTFNIDPQAVRYFLERECRRHSAKGFPVHRATGRIIKVLLPVHYGGHPCAMDELMALADEFNLTIVEDAAHAIGARYHGRPVGSLGHITCFSFYATKNMTTGEGGLVTTNRDDLAQRIRVLAMYGISDARRIWTRYAPKGSWVYDIKELGFKYNMMDIQAALGLHQIGELDHFIKRRRENAAIYECALAGLSSVRLPSVRPRITHARHLYPLLLDPDRLRIGRDDFIERLKTLNIGTSVLFIPLHLHSYYQDALPYREGDFPVAEDIFRRIVNLPVSPAIPSETIARVAETIAGLIKESTVG
jgi:dTDP-4-amino-4,6-dideoxygalactose transaminase